MRAARQILSLTLLFVTAFGCGGPKPKKVATLTGHQAKVTAAAFAPDGRTFASGDEDGVLKLWDYAADKELASEGTKVAPDDPEPRIEFIAFSPDSSRLAVERWRTHPYSVHPNQYAEDLELWQVDPLRKLQTFDTQASALCFTPDGKSLLMGTLDGVLLWDINQGESVGEWQIGHVPQSVAIASDGSWAAVGTFPDAHDDSKSRILVRIDLKDGAPLRTLPGGHEFVGTHLKISADGKTLWHAPGDGQIQQVNTETWTIERNITLRSDAGAVFAPDSDCYASLYDEIGLFSGHREISFGELPSGATYRLSDNGLPSYLPLALSTDGRTFALRHGRLIDLWQRP
jgi:WD40 repeat protein